MNKKVLLTMTSLLLVSLVLFSSPVYAQEDQLPEPGITPDSPFYFLDNWGKGLGLFFAFGPEAKAEKALEYAGERLAEAQAMAAEKRTQALEKATKGYEQFLSVASEKAVEATQQASKEDVSEIVAEATGKHLTVLYELKNRLQEQERVSEQAIQAIERAYESSMNGQENALRALSRVNPEEAIEINLAAIENRLERARNKAKEGDTEEVEEALAEAEELSNFGSEISEIAKGLGKDITTVEDRIARATSLHLEVLVEVLENVPEQAQTAVENAIANMMVNREEVLQRLEDKGAIGNIPREVPALEGFREQVMERVQERIEENVPENLQQQIMERIENRLSNLGPQTSKSSR
ncbi:DUF5667 domain-containing protein [Chloroflexota bacterium]